MLKPQQITRLTGGDNYFRNAPISFARGRQYNAPLKLKDFANLDAFAFSLAERYAPLYHSRLSLHLKKQIPNDDIFQTIYTKYLEKKHLIDTNKFPKTYILRIFDSAFIDLDCRIPGSQKGRSINGRLPGSVVIDSHWDNGMCLPIDTETPETIAMGEGGYMPNVEEVIETELEELCDAVGLKIDADNQLLSVLQVCDKVLNHYTEEEFQALHYQKRKRIVELSEALKTNSVVLSSDKNKIIYKGSTKRVRELFARGYTTASDVMVQLEKEGAYYKNKSVRSIINKMRTEAGLEGRPERKRSVKYEVESIFNSGKGIIRTREVIEALIELRESKGERTNINTSYVLNLVSALRKKHNMTNFGPRAGLTRKKSGLLDE